MKWVILIFSILLLLSSRFLLAILLFIIFLIINRNDKRNKNETNRNINKDQNVEREKVTTIDEVIKIGSNIKNEEKEEEIKEETKRPVVTNEMSNFLKEYNNIFKINNILIKDFDDSYPEFLAQKICSKTNKYFTKLIFLDTKKLTFIDFDKNEFLLLSANNSSKIEMVIKVILNKMQERYNLLLEKSKKNISDYNNSVQFLDEVIPYIFIFVNDIYDIKNISKDCYNNLLQIILDGHKLGISLIIFSNINKKYLKLDIVKNSLNELNQDDSNKLLDEILSTIPSINDSELKEYEEYKQILNDEDKKEIEEYDDPLYGEVVDFVVEGRKASTSLIQRRFRIGYSRASRIIDLLEERGVIGPQNGSKPREVLIDKK